MEDKVALISGAATGIGAATALLFASSGYKKLALLDIKEEQLEDVAAKCEAKGAQVARLVVNLKDSEAAKAVVKTVLDRFGRRI